MDIPANILDKRNNIETFSKMQTNIYPENITVDKEDLGIVDCYYYVKEKKIIRPHPLRTTLK